MSLLAFLDMDGVIVDCVAGMCQVHERPSPYTDPSYVPGNFLGTWWGMSQNDLWDPINAEGVGFWANLKKTPEADSIVEAVVEAVGFDNIAVLSAPSMDPACIAGKRVWLDTHYPSLSKNAIFTSAKHFLAGPNRVLIDDQDNNIKAFQEAGGNTILVPRPWNRAHPLAGSAINCTDLLGKLKVLCYNKS